MRRLRQFGWLQALLLMQVVFCGVFAGAKGRSAAASSHAGVSQASYRYLYILNCFGDLDKLDALTSKRIARVNLAQHSRLIPTHGDSANSVVDGCSTYGAVYLPKQALMYTLSPTTGSVREGVHRLRLLSFRIPSLQQAGSIDLPDTYDPYDGPTISEDSAGSIVVTSRGRSSRVVASRLVPRDAAMPELLPGSRPSATDASSLELNLALYHVVGLSFVPEGEHLTYVPLEQSADTVLLKFLDPNEKGWAFAVANRATKHLVRLNLPFESTESNVHLAPGGQTVLAQQATYTSIERISKTTDRLALLDAASGAVSKSWTNPDISDLHALTLTPQGKIVFFGEKIKLIPTGLSFPSQPVVTLDNSSGPSFFYADR